MSMKRWEGEFHREICIGEMSSDGITLHWIPEDYSTNGTHCGRWWVCFSSTLHQLSKDILLRFAFSKDFIVAPLVSEARDFCARVLISSVTVKILTVKNILFINRIYLRCGKKTQHKLFIISTTRKTMAKECVECVGHKEEKQQNCIFHVELEWTLWANCNSQCCIK